MRKKFWLAILRGRYHSEDLDTGGRIILKWFLEKLCLVGVYWIHLNQDRDRWRAVVNKVMNIRVP
jgi:hypothetical protein